ncbi:aldo/keto reductase [Kineosporia babensis]|uniref:Aldo/keto reductase n=1 Tax=Kineosporia babensis TaxID=499548 RepID=A0A9X1T3G5_9ACTN|nr:aldo/keto reductase [Kineosporia babensis]MCD5315718.1 aldo/keto reductase [Kineosporia babensis]
MSGSTDLHVRLGRTGLLVSRLGLGTVNFGGRLDEAQAHRLLDHAHERGINLVDTASVYGWRVYKGWTEEVIGRWAARGSRRDDVIVSTKVGLPMSDVPNDSGLSLRNIVRSCEASLRRLQTDWIDLFQIHHVDRSVAWDEIWQAMELLVQQGKVRYVGSSNCAGWDLAAAQESARRRGVTSLASEQCLYNLATREPELEILPAAEAYGIGVLVWSPLHSGLLSGVLAKQAAGEAVKSAQGRSASALAQHRDQIAEYEKVCHEAGRPPAQAGLAWVLSRPEVSGAIIGPRTTEHIDDALRAWQEPLSEDLASQLESLFPAPGRGFPAPDAWIG